MTETVADEINAALVGQSCRVERHGHGWLFRFGDSVRLTVECAWRIVANGRIAHAARDDAQRFGLPEQIDGAARRGALLTGCVVAVAVDQATADLKIRFANGNQLEAFNDSSGYEAWQLKLEDGAMLVAQGGGAVVRVG